MRESLRHEETVVVWDWPARITHWGFSFSLSIALAVGFFCDPEGALFTVHIFAAYLAAWFLAVRIVLGFAGSRYLRWASLFQSPSSLFRYFGSVWRRERETSVGLNPASAAFALAIYGCLVGLIFSGLQAEFVETWHGRLAYGSLCLITIHLAGLFLHALRHRALTPLAMVHGRVAGRAGDGLKSTGAAAGLILFLLSLCVVWLLLGYYDGSNAVIAVPGLPEIPVPVVQKG
jgi:cytochrome b